MLPQLRNPASVLKRKRSPPPAAAHRNVLLGMAASHTGTWMFRLAQDWVILAVLASEPAAVGYATTLQLIPFVVLTLLAGRLADRRDPWKVVVAASSLGFLASMGMAVLLWMGTLTLSAVYVCAVLLGTSAALDGPARARVLTDLIEQDRTAQSVAWRTATYEGSRLIGFPLAGILLTVVGPGWVVALNAVSFIPSAATAYASRLSAHPAPSPSSPSVWLAVRHVASTPHLRKAALLLFSFSLTAGNFQVALTPLLVSSWGVPARNTGWALSFIAAGALLGSWSTSRPSTASLRGIRVSCVMAGLAVIGVGLAPSMPSLVVAVSATGAAVAAAHNTATSFALSGTHEQMHGRVNAILKHVNMLGAAAGSFATARLLSHGTPGTALVALGSVAVLGTAVLTVRMRRQPEASGGPDSGSPAAG